MNLKKEIEGCTMCTLYEFKNNIVYGQINLDSHVVFIGEAPGKTEDNNGEIYSGNSGLILNNHLMMANIDRSKVSILNLLKCRPPDDREPKINEVISCSYWLDKQLKLIDPIVVVPIGKIPTMSIFLKKKIYPNNEIEIVKSDIEFKNIRGKVTKIKKQNGKILHIIPILHVSQLKYLSKGDDIMQKDLDNVKFVCNSLNLDILFAQDNNIDF